MIMNSLPISWVKYFALVNNSKILSMRVFLRDRRSIWWGWIVTPVAPRIVNEVSYVMRTKSASLPAWQAQYLVTPVAPRIVNEVSYVMMIK